MFNSSRGRSWNGGNSFFRFRSQPFGPYPTAVTHLIWLNVLIFLGIFILKIIPAWGLWRSISDVLVHYLAYRPTDSLLLNLHAFLTSIFVHEQFFHLFGNMLWLYFIGIILEDLIGKKHIYKLFIGGGISGVALYAFVSLFSGSMDPLIGASAGISAILIATAIFTPHYRLMLFGVIEVELRWIVIAKIVFDVLGMFGAMNSGGAQAHVGGYLFGLAYITELKGFWNFPDIQLIPKKKPKRSANVSINNPKSNGSPNQDEIDRILDKISAGGYDSLSKKEKETLFSASKKK
jgi:membrane associated rhomboid family serine protease